MDVANERVKGSIVGTLPGKDRQFDGARQRTGNSILQRGYPPNSKNEE